MVEIRKFTEDENIKTVTIQSSKNTQLNIVKVYVFENFRISAISGKLVFFPLPFRNFIFYHSSQFSTFIFAYNGNSNTVRLTPYMFYSLIDLWIFN